jgi:16S rRNA (guanine1207-N2)-methyltransferase
VSDNHYYKSSHKRASQYILISDFIRGITVEFEAIPGLFSYKYVDEGTKLLLEYAEIPSEGAVLDVGCGYGVIGITIAKLNPRLKVYMIDVNEEAVRLTKRNVARNGLKEDRVIVLQGDVYEPVKDMTFNAIYSNPPFAAGLHIVKRIVIEAPHYMKPDATLQIVARKGAEKVKNLMCQVFGNVETKISKKGYKVLLSRKQAF